MMELFRKEILLPEKPFIKTFSVTTQCAYNPTPEFYAQSTKELSNDEIHELQTKAGYDPRGYGLYRFKHKKENELYVYTWNCYGSCD